VGVVLEILAVLWPVFLKVLPLIIKAFFGDKTAIDRARDIQSEVRKEALLMNKGDEDEISRREKTRMAVLDMALRMRGSKSSK
jgi:hypothetical protein